MSGRGPEQGFGEGVAGLARLLLPSTGMPRALDTIARLAPRAVAGCDSASVSLKSVAAENTGVRLAEQAAVVVLAAMAHDRVEQLADQLRAALASRAVIEQAKGIIMARSRTDAGGAFAILRRSSHRQNVKLREVARQIVDGAQSPPA